MTQVRNTLGRLVQRLVGKARVQVPGRHVQPPKELDARVVSQVSGGVGESIQAPRQGW